MANIAHDLFLLMNNLTQLKNRHRMITVFIEAINSLHPDFSVEFIEGDHGGHRPDTKTIDICTAKNHFGKFKLKGSLQAVAPEFPGLFQNAVQMLAIILEKFRQEKLLADEKLALKEMVDEKTASLRESEEKYRRLFETMAQGVVYQDAAGKITSANPASQRILGLTPQQITGRTSVDPRWKAIHEDGSTFTGRTHPAMVALRTGRKVSNVIMGVYNPVENEYRWINTNAIPEFREGEDKPYQVYTTFDDITERKQTEEELRRLRNYLSNIIDSMPSVVVGVDTEGKVTQWNRQAEQETGIKAAAAAGRKLQEVFPRLAAAAEIEKIEAAMREHQAQRDLKMPRQEDGKIRYEDVTVYPLITNGVEGAVIRIDDVTKHVQLEEMMIQSEKMLSVGGLAAGMAHEINNPLAGMMQNASVLINRLTGDLPANHKAAAECGTDMTALRSFMEKRNIIKLLKMIHESGSRAARIVRNMLSFARKSESKNAPNDLGQLLDTTVELAANDYDLKRKYDFRQIGIIREYEPGMPLVSCEASKIQQVFLNLLKNGAEAMREGRVKKPRFVLRISREGDMARMEFEDNGPGMDEATRKRIFEPFFTTKEVGEGTGLGLSVSYFIITENHGGTMRVESSSAKGTKFIIRLPIKRRTQA